MKIGDKVRVKTDYPSWAPNGETSDSNTYRRRGQTGKVLGFGNRLCYVAFDIDDRYLHIYTDALELIEDEFVVPKQWHINVTTKEQAKVVGRWFDQSEFGHGDHDSFYETQADIGIYGGVSAGNVYGHTVGTKITFEQFEKYILNNKTNMKKEIIGYKSPVQIGPNPKGTLYVVYGGSGDLYNAQYQTSMYTVPKEIVETWEPVYKEDQTKTLVLGTSRIKVVISKGKIDVDNGNEIDLNDLYMLNESLQGCHLKIKSTREGTKDYTVSFPKGVKIGCSEFEASEIKQIIDTYNELNK